MSNDPNDRWYSALDGIKEKKTVESEITKRYPAAAPITITYYYNKDVDPRLYGTKIE